MELTPNFVKEQRQVELITPLVEYVNNSESYGGQRGLDIQERNALIAGFEEMLKKDEDDESNFGGLSANAGASAAGAARSSISAPGVAPSVGARPSALGVAPGTGGMESSDIIESVSSTLSSVGIKFKGLLATGYQLDEKRAIHEYVNEFAMYTAYTSNWILVTDRAVRNMGLPGIWETLTTARFDYNTLHNVTPFVISLLLPFRQRLGRAAVAAVAAGAAWERRHPARGSRNDADAWHHVRTTDTGSRR